ncbi:MAG: putative glycoside hydrolase, partial [Treponema sp.]|nr:putative glycoside hydrolase [Treponema sp.]
MRLKLSSNFRFQPVRFFALCILSVLFIQAAYTGPAAQRKPGGKETAESTEENTVESTAPDRLFLAGTARGLYSIDGKGNAVCLRPGPDVRKIIRAGSAWLILSGDGIFRSSDLRQWENRGGGLPVKTIKVFEDGKKSFVSAVQDIKDLEVNTSNPDVMVCAVRDAVFLSVDGGISWRSLGSPALRTDGIKAAASAYLPAGESSELVIFMSHSVYGCYYITPDIPGAAWTAISGGLEELETTGNADEVSDISVSAGPDGSPVIYVSQTFRKRVYRLDWSGKRFVPLWSGGEDFGAVDSLDPGTERLRFLAEGAVYETRVNTFNSETRGETRERRDIADLIRNTAAGFEPDLLCAFIEGKDETVSLSELWLLLPAKARKPQAAGRKGLYLPVNHAGDPSLLKPYLDIIASRGLDMIVVDMKDDYG